MLYNSQGANQHGQSNLQRKLKWLISMSKSGKGFQLKNKSCHLFCVKRKYNKTKTKTLGNKEIIGL
jgi:hypothetical protein